jgi:hypothetical protein
MRKEIRSAAAFLLAACLLAACAQSSATEVRGHPIRPHDLDAMALGKTTPPEIVARFGEPDERAADGSITYRSSVARRSRSGLVGLWHANEEKVEDETVTFRFENGALAKICRSRS